MLARTHLLIGVLFIALFLPHVSYKLVFVPLILIASLLPDIDSAFSVLGKKKIMRPLQWIVSHRGVIHSLTLDVILSLALALFWPPLGLPVFLGYSAHLLADSFSHEGIKPFWPLKKEVSGSIRVGGKRESILFWVLVAITLILFGLWFL